MALVLPPPTPFSPMTTSILLRSSRSPSPSPSPASTPLPALQPDFSSSSSSNSGSCLDLHRTSSAPSTRRIRFAPLPDLHRQLSTSSITSYEQPQSEVKSATQPLPAQVDHSVALSPSISPDSTLSSAHSTPTIRVSPNASAIKFQKPNSRLFRPLAFLRRAQSSVPNSSPLSYSASLPASRDPSPSSLVPSISSVPNSPSWSSKLPRFATEDILSGTRSIFRTRSGSTASFPHARPSSPPPQSLYRSSSTGSGPGMKPGTGQRDSGQGSSQSHNSFTAPGSGARKRRASSSALSPGAGGGRHGSSVRMVTDSSRPSTAPSLPTMSPKKQGKMMLNGRVYGGRRYAAQTLANPFANVREEPEFVEWGYGGMGSVHASAGIGNDMWKGLQRGERGGALLAGSSFGSPSTPAIVAGGGRGSGARSTVCRKMANDVPECGMENVGAGGGIDEDDGSGMAWLKKRRAEKEAKARLEQEAKSQERRKSGDSIDASMYASTASTSTSLTACTSAASTNVTTPLTSRSPSVIDLTLTSSPSSEPCDLHAAPSGAESDQQSSIIPSPAHPASKDEHERHVLTAVRIPSISTLPHKHGHPVTHGRTSLSDELLQLSKDSHDDVTEQAVPLSPTDTETTSAGSVGGDEGEQDDMDDEETEAQDIRRKTSVGAGVEKISRHVDVVTR